MNVNRLQSISASDKKLFQYNSDIMNECFGGNYNHYFNDPTKEVYGGYVWFPKERVKDRFGEWKPGSNEVNWKNYMTDDGQKIYMYVNPGETAKASEKERPTKSKDRATPCYTFMKSEKYDGYYKFLGTFMFDLNASTGDVHMLRKLQDTVDLSIWYNNLNEGYYNVDGHPAFKHMYLYGDFKEHMKAIESFDAKKSADVYCNKTRDFLEKYSLPKIARLGEDFFKTEYVDALINIIQDVYGAELTRKDLYPGGKSFQEIGMAYFELLNAPEDHNKLLNNSIFDSRVAGMIMGIYNPFYYIYGLDDDRLASILEKLNFKDFENESRIEKCCLIYFWKQCMDMLDEWSVPAFMSFIGQL